jgi:hypothetical protein
MQADCPSRLLRLSFFLVNFCESSLFFAKCKNQTSFIIGAGHVAIDMTLSLKVFRLPLRLTASSLASAHPFSHWMVMGLIVILCLLELGAYFTHGAIPVIASRAWAFMGIAYFAATAILIVGALLSDLWKRKFVFALLVISLGIMVFYGLGNIYHLPINYESAQQLDSFLKGQCP